MTAVIILAAIAAVAPTVAAVAALVTSIRAGRVLSAQVAAQGSKLEVVHELVNSRLTAALDKIDRLEAQLQTLTGHTPTGEPPPDASMNKPTDLIPRRNDPQKPVAGEQHESTEKRS